MMPIRCAVYPCTGDGAVSGVRVVRYADPPVYRGRCSCQVAYCAVCCAVDGARVRCCAACGGRCSFSAVSPVISVLWTVDAYVYDRRGVLCTRVMLCPCSVYGLLFTLHIACLTVSQEVMKQFYAKPPSTAAEQV